MAVWTEVLGLSDIAPDDDFFHLGGHSLLAGQVAARLRAALGVELSVDCLFDAPTVTALAECIRELRTEEQPRDAELKPVAKAPVTRYLASFAQQRQWFLHQVHSGSTAYTVAEAVTLIGALDVAALSRALTDLVHRHDTLRTRFEPGPAGPVAVLDTVGRLPLPIEDLGRLPRSQRNAAVDRLAAEVAAAPFDLAVAPPMRTRLLRVGPRRHILVVAVHHIATDGWSMALFWQELGALYGAYARGLTAPLPKLSTRYADYAAWQHSRSNDDERAEQLTYWRHALAGAPAVLELPTDRPCPAVQSFRGAQHSFTVPEATVRRLRALGAAHRATLFMTLLAAFEVMLARLTGQFDVAVGTPVAGRSRREWEGLIGFFVNTLVIRTDLSGDPTFAEVLRRVRAAALGAFAHQDLPFEQLVADLAPERSTAHNPLFQVMFVLHNAALDEIRIPGLRVEPLSLDTRTAKFDLKLLLTERGNRLDGLLEYATDLFDESTANRLLAQYWLLVDGILADPGLSMYAYPLLTPAAVEVLPDPVADLGEPAFLPVPAMVAAWARRAPELPACRHRGRTWTYAQLHVAAAAVAQALVDGGLRPGETVAVLGSRSFGLVAAMLGVLVSGGVLLPVDPALPDRRRALMMREGRAAWLVHTDAEPAARSPSDGDDPTAALPPGRELQVCPDSGVVRGAVGESSGQPLPEVSGEDPAYIMFTSGTTGTAKAVVGSHRGISHFVCWERETFDIGPGDRVAQLTSLSFDPVLRDVFVPLSSGATVCLPDPEATRPPAVLKWMDSERVTVLHVVPSVAQWWLAEAPPHSKVVSLRHVLFAGEPLTGNLVSRWGRMFPGAAVANLYGPTETTQSKCFTPISEPVPGIQPIGRPLPNTQALVLNPAGRLCGPGELGEIVIRTPFRTLGYLDPAAPEARRFCVNPFNPNPLDVVYRTGDLGRYCDDGTLQIAGRVDDQVKIRGVRIEPAEVAAALSQQPGVDRCCVVARRDDTGRTALVGYVVPDRTIRPTVQRLTAGLSRELPTVMVPAHLLFVPALPLTTNGKLDRARLPEPTRPPRAGTRAPDGPTEEIVAGLFGALLGADRIEADDNFFTLGGDSMAATLLVGRIRESLGVELGVPAVFERQTVAQLASRVDELSARLGGDDGPLGAAAAGSGTGPTPPAPLPLRRAGPATSLQVGQDESP
jgi:amino acid adenylation domain-containing protein